MTDPFQTCAFQLIEGDIHSDDPSSGIAAIAVSRFEMVNNKWQVATSTWLGSGAVDPEAEALFWLGRALGPCPLVTWDTAQFRSMLEGALAAANDNSRPGAVHELAMVAQALRYNTIGDARSLWPEAQALADVSGPISSPASLVHASAKMAEEEDLLARHQAIRAEAEFLGEAWLAGCGRAGITNW